MDIFSHCNFSEMAFALQLVAYYNFISSLFYILLVYELTLNNIADAISDLMKFIFFQLYVLFQIKIGIIFM